MTFEQTPLRGACIVRYESMADARGSFARVFDSDRFEREGLAYEFPQHGVARNSRANILRGMHFQTGDSAEAKVIRCVFGEVHDVIVDVRPASATFRHWFALRLAAARDELLYVPAGFAHGYQTLSERSELHYLISARYEPQAARGFRWDDPSVGILWPLADPLLSERDAALPSFERAIEL